MPTGNATRGHRPNRAQRKARQQAKRGAVGQWPAAPTAPVSPLYAPASPPKRLVAKPGNRNAHATAPKAHAWATGPGGCRYTVKPATPQWGQAPGNAGGKARLATGQQYIARLRGPSGAVQRRLAPSPLAAMALCAAHASGVAGQPVTLPWRGPWAATLLAPRKAQAPSNLGPRPKATGRNRKRRKGGKACPNGLQSHKPSGPGCPAPKA